MWDSKTDARTVTAWMCEEGGSEEDPIFIMVDGAWAETTLNDLTYGDSNLIERSEAGEVKIKFYGESPFDGKFGLRTGTLYAMYLDRSKGIRSNSCQLCGHEVEGTPDLLNLRVDLAISVLAEGISREGDDVNDMLNDIITIIQKAFECGPEEYFLDKVEFDGTEEIE